MTAQAASQPPRTKARIAGVFYLLTILTGALALSANGSSRVALLIGSTACYIAVTILFYGLFLPANRRISVLAAGFSLLGCAQSLLGVFDLSLPGLNPLVFFGCYCLLIGYLILRSRFLPGFLGVLMALGGLGWLTFISPISSKALSPYNMAPGILGEAALTIWLLAAGVNSQRWKEQAGSSA